MCCNSNSKPVFGIGTFGGCNRGCSKNSRIRLCENGCGGIDVQFVDGCDNSRRSEKCCCRCCCCKCRRN